MNKLGECDRCRDPNSLYIVGYNVVCRRCGVKANHPVTIQMQQATEPALDREGKLLLNRDGKPSGLRKLKEQPQPLPRIYLERNQTPEERLRVENAAMQERVAALEQQAAQQQTPPAKSRKGA